MRIFLKIEVLDGLGAHRTPGWIELWSPNGGQGGAAARRPGAPSAPLRRPSPQPGAYLCAAPRGRGARAEHLTVSIAHGSLTRRPFLQ